MPRNGLLTSSSAWLQQLAILGTTENDVSDVGIASIAGPAVGSDQCLATAPAKLNGAPTPDAVDAIKQCEALAGHTDVTSTPLPVVPQTAAADAVRACVALAGPHVSALSTQIVNVAYGTRDRDGKTKPKYPYHMFEPWMNLHPGMYEVASISWAEYNGRAYQTLYGDTGCKWSLPAIVGESGRETSVIINGVTRISKVEMEGIGHAWAAGVVEDGSGGAWIAQKGFNYPKYIMSWFLANQQRGKGNVPGPEVKFEDNQVTLCQ